MPARCSYASRSKQSGRTENQLLNMDRLEARAQSKDRQAITASGMAPVISITKLTKKYASGFQALQNIDLEIRSGEIFALLGPNGAGKTTLISIICGLVTASAGRVLVAGRDINNEYRTTRSLIGLVPQELANDMFTSVWSTV